MRNLKKISLAVLVVCSATSSLVLAQSADYNPSWYITPSLSMLRPDSGFNVSDRGEAAGISVGKPLSEYWDIQIGTKYGRENHDGLKYQQNLLGVDGLLMLSREEIRPFLLMGAGYQQDRLSSALGERSGYAPYVNAGVGVQIALNDQWSLQADFRREHGYLRNNNFDISRNNNNYLTVGISYAFDKSPVVAVAKVTPPPPPPPAQTIVQVVQTPAPPPPPRFEKIVLSSTELFGFDQYALQLPQPKLDEIANALVANPTVNNVVITGYTDRIGTAKYNQKLSERRANSVKEYLVGKNVGAERLVTEGKGEANPLVTCTEKKLKALIVCLEPNRRVEVEQITINQRVTK
ncbi:OmpA family protein [Sapientia aquatica]|uniref:OmpA family protein n=1 Tax=Sapientia aquatica TaxID=1549640 RepID=A0A4R5W375_9BURK|nr:OmpA family protein [Sapientia aquatica]TDK67101.1 OmpA family protein [Sapientia aquatica]